MNAPNDAVRGIDGPLIAKLRTPLDDKAVAILATVVHEHPEHVVSVDGLWLVLSHPQRSRGMSECDHAWLDRPESDSRECLICGVEVFG